MPKYRFQLSEVGNTGSELNLEGTIEAVSKVALQELVLKMLLPFYKLGAEEKLMLINTSNTDFKYETYGICVGSDTDWDCCGFFEILDEN